MTAVTPAGSPAAPPPGPASTAPTGRASALPPPSVAALEPQDALGMMIVAMERMSQASIAQTEKRLHSTQERMRERLDEFLDKVEKAIEAAQRAAEAAKQEDDGGWFGDVVDCVADVVGEVVGTVVDFIKDAVEAPIELTEGVVTNIGDPQAMLNAVKGQMLELATNGETADSVKGFTKGVTKLAAKLVEFGAKFSVALAENGGDFKAAWESIKEEAKELWTSFQKNILENPDFFEVAGAIVKAAAVAAAVMSGGTLAWVAVAAFVLCEADQRYGFVEKVVGKDAAPWVRLGMQLAATALLGAAAAQGDAGAIVKYFQAGTAILGGAASINDGLRALEEGERRAEALERQADVHEVIGRMARLQRLMDGLIEALEEHTDDRRTTFDMSNTLFQTQAATEAATVMRA